MKSEKREPITPLSWPQRIALAPLVVVAYFLPLSLLAIVGLELTTISAGSAVECHCEN